MSEAEPNITKDDRVEKEARHLVHHALAHSYTVYFFVLLFGVALDLLFPIKIFSSAFMKSGLVLMVLASVLIAWAQRSSDLTKGLRDKREELTHHHFLNGPYRYSRTPTHWGLFLLVLGFSLVINAFFIAVLTVVSFAVTKVFFLKNEEKHLENRYGEPYREYKKKVRL